MPVAVAGPGCRSPDPAAGRLASAYEVRACFDTAVAMRYLAEPAFDTRDRVERIIATLIKLSR